MGWNPLKDSWGAGTSDWNAAEWATFGYGGLSTATDYAEQIGKGVESVTNRLASMNAQLIRDESAENVRRSTLQFEDLKNQVIGIQSSSGFLSSSASSKSYVSRMEESFQKEIEYINKATESQVEITLLEGQIQGEMAKDAERSQSLGFVGDIVGILG